MGKKEYFDPIHDALTPCVIGPTPFSKWKRYPEMGHLITSAYNMVCIDMTRFGFSETFFPLRSEPPKDPSGCIMCIAWLSNSLHLVEVYLKSVCPIPRT